MSEALNRSLINELYGAFARRDGAAMARCYSPKACFRDPAFGELRGPQIGAMWTMLTTRARELDIQWRDIHADETTGRVHWTARYVFAKTGNHVVNEIDAQFKFADGLIIEHIDQFSFWGWSRQALGTPGLLLGWTPWLKAQVRREARNQLERTMSKAAGKKSKL